MGIKAWIWSDGLSRKEGLKSIEASIMLCTPPPI